MGIPRIPRQIVVFERDHKNREKMALRPRLKKNRLTFYPLRKSAIVTPSAIALHSAHCRLRFLLRCLFLGSSFVSTIFIFIPIPPSSVLLWTLWADCVPMHIASQSLPHSPGWMNLYIVPFVLHLRRCRWQDIDSSNVINLSKSCK